MTTNEHFTIHIEQFNHGVHSLIIRDNENIIRWRTLHISRRTAEDKALELTEKDLYPQWRYKHFS